MDNDDSRQDIAPVLEGPRAGALVAELRRLREIVEANGEQGSWPKGPKWGSRPQASMGHGFVTSHGTGHSV
jgi:hypothetical protein